MKIVGIAAVSKNGVIGKEGELPWDCKDDLIFFRLTTEGNVVLMGRKTFESLPNGPFKDRVNVVVSREHEPVEPPHVKNVKMGDFYVFNDLERAIHWATGYSRYIEQEQFYVIGGATIYEQANKYITDWLITHIPLSIEGDTLFPVDLSSKVVYRVDKIHATANTFLRSRITQKGYVGTIPYFLYYNGNPDKLVLLDRHGLTDPDVLLTLETNLYNVRVTDGKLKKTAQIFESLSMIEERVMEPD